jgi:hypothetical protein
MGHHSVRLAAAGRRATIELNISASETTRQVRSESKGDVAAFPGHVCFTPDCVAKLGADSSNRQKQAILEYEGLIL